MMLWISGSMSNNKVRFRVKILIRLSFSVAAGFAHKVQNTLKHSSEINALTECINGSYLFEYIGQWL